MQPRDLADEMSCALALTTTFTLPIAEARNKAREIINRGSYNGTIPVVEKWRQRPDGQIEFTVRHFQASR